MRDTSPRDRHGVVFTVRWIRNCAKLETNVHHLDHFKPSARLKTAAKPK